MEIVAEIGWNFMGNLALAKKMIKDARKSGANTVKFQFWKTSTLKEGPWNKDGRIEIYKKAELNEKKILKLINYCNSIKINFLISCFSLNDLRYLKSLGISAIKIPSHEIYNVEMHKFASKNFDKIYVSLGAGTKKEILKTIGIYNKNNCNWVGMHCVSAYPCPLEKFNLPKLKFLKKYVSKLGISDHTLSTITPSLSVPFGVEVVEKHFTSDKNLPGRDNKFALNKFEFKEMVKFIREAQKININNGIEALEIENDTIKLYRGRWDN